MELMCVETVVLALRRMGILLYAIVLSDLMALIVNKVNYFRAHYICADWASIPLVAEYFNLSFLSLSFIDICSPHGQNVCANGGSCVVSDGNSFSCKCSKEFDGKRCENGNSLFNRLYIKK